MALIGHWVAADAGGAGSTLVDRSASAADGTLTGGCTWTTINGEAAVNCPDGDMVEVPDNAMWTLGDFIGIARISFNGASGKSGFLSHEPGGGFAPKWAWHHGGASEGQRFYANDATNSNEDLVSSTGWARSADVIYALGVKRSSGTYYFYRDGATDGSVVGVSTLPFDPATTLKLFYGGEAYFGGGIKGIALRIYDDATLSDADIFAAMVADAPVSKALAENVSLGLTDSVAIQSIDSIGPLADTASLALTESLSVGQNEAISVADTAALGLTESVTVLPNPLFLTLTDTGSLGLTEILDIQRRLPLPDLVALGLTESITVEANPATLRLTWNELIRGDGEATLHLDWFEISSPASDPVVLRITWDERQGFGGSLRLSWREVPDLPTPSWTAPQKPTATVTVS